MGVVHVAKQVEVEEAERGGVASPRDPCVFGAQSLREGIAVRRACEGVEPGPGALLSQALLEAEPDPVAEPESEQQARRESQGD